MILAERRTEIEDDVSWRVYNHLQIKGLFDENKASELYSKYPTYKIQRISS